MTTAPALAVRSSDFIAAGLDDRSLRRLRERGRLARVVPGAYVDADLWGRLSDRERYVTRVHSTVSRLQGPVAISHWSAAAVWGFPVPDAWPESVQVVDPRRASSNSIPTLHRRPGILPPDEVVDWEGLLVTTPSRTAADLALVSGFADAVVVFDHCLFTGVLDPAIVRGLFDRRRTARRRRSALAALDFSRAGAASPGESFSRVALASRGFPEPVLQAPFADHRGPIGLVDFWWPERGIVGEFDGDVKYTDPRYTRGRTAAEVVTEEKRRQARLRAVPGVRDVVRWDYSVARDPDELARRLLAAGLPRLNPRARLPRWS